MCLRWMEVLRWLKEFVERDMYVYTIYARMFFKIECVGVWVAGGIVYE